VGSNPKQPGQLMHGVANGVVKAKLKLTHYHAVRNSRPHFPKMSIICLFTHYLTILSVVHGMQNVLQRYTKLKDVVI
jgi:hypothetical protein